MEKEELFIINNYKVLEHIDSHGGYLYPEELFKKEFYKLQVKVIMKNIRSKGIICQTSLES